MVTQIEEILMDNINATYKTISIRKITIFLNENIEVARSDPWRGTFYPGQIDQVKSITGWTDETPEITYLKLIWTQDVIDAFNQYQNQGA